MLASSSLLLRYYKHLMLNLKKKTELDFSYFTVDRVKYCGQRSILRWATYSWNNLYVIESIAYKF